MYKLKYTTAELAEEFAAVGCELLSEYNGAKHKLVYKCVCGNISSIQLGHFRRGLRCGCKLKTKLSLADVQQEFLDKGCILLSEEFSNVLKPLNYICKCGTKSTTTLVNFRRGHDCIKCGILKVSGVNNPRYIHDRDTFTLQNKFKSKCRMAIHHTLRRLGKRKQDSTIKLLGYSALDLQNHIMSHQNWEFVKDSNWELDHIFPIAAFLQYDIKDIQLINCLDNLQPLSKDQNNRKQDKYDCEQFEEWLRIKKIEFTSQLSQAKIQ